MSAFLQCWQESRALMIHVFLQRSVVMTSWASVREHNCCPKANFQKPSERRLHHHQHHHISFVTCVIPVFYLRVNNSSEAALVKVTNDFLIASDRTQSLCVCTSLVRSQSCICQQWLSHLNLIFPLSNQALPFAPTDRCRTFLYQKDKEQTSSCDCSCLAGLLQFLMIRRPNKFLKTPQLIQNAAAMSWQDIVKEILFSYISFTMQAPYKSSSLVRHYNMSQR